ncbi:hypothetical protein KBY58_11760 [Cyanobium sp. HWJ4-Hawea]|nr:hypothetical protein [Cyanobium sp. HWJ4-Hawea]
MKQSGFSILYINNSLTDKHDHEEVLQLCWRAFDRKNIGRDFGAFKDAVLLLHSEGHLHQCELLCIANDSMQFIPGRYADDLIKRINTFSKSSSKGLFSHASHQIETHYQSYFQILKPAIFRSKLFIEFWQDYVPLSNRIHCIRKGEIALSSKVYRRFQPVEVLYRSDALVSILSELRKNDEGVSGEEILGMIPSPTRTLEKTPQAVYALEQIIGKSHRREMLSAQQFYNIADLIENSNPSHVAAFLYPFFLHCPFIKHDLCSAGSFTAAQAIYLYEEALKSSSGQVLTQKLLESFVDEFKQLVDFKGTPLSYSNKLKEATTKGVANGFIYSRVC